MSVHIPDADSANQNLLIIGEAGNAANAEKHIMRLMEKVDERAKVFRVFWFVGIVIWLFMKCDMFIMFVYYL